MKKFSAIDSLFGRFFQIDSRIPHVYDQRFLKYEADMVALILHQANHNHHKELKQTVHDLITVSYLNGVHDQSSAVADPANP